MVGGEKNISVLTLKHVHLTLNSGSSIYLFFNISWFVSGNMMYIHKGVDVGQGVGKHWDCDGYSFVR